jgi:hypothetical protein
MRRNRYLFAVSIQFLRYDPTDFLSVGGYPSLGNQEYPLADNFFDLASSDKQPGISPGCEIPFEMHLSLGYVVQNVSQILILPAPVRPLSQWR